MDDTLHIGLTGRKGSGKNLAADYIKAADPSFYVVAFADPLRDVCKTIFGLSDKEMNDRELKETPLTRYPFVSPREIMQRVGTDCIRSQFPDAWMNAWRCRVKPFPRTVTTDTRFPNEAEAIRELGGYIVRIIRPSLGELVDSHSSETSMDQIPADKTVINDGTPELLRARVLAAVAELKEGR